MSNIGCTAYTFDEEKKVDILGNIFAVPLFVNIHDNYCLLLVMAWSNYMVPEKTFHSCEDLSDRFIASLSGKVIQMCKAPVSASWVFFPRFYDSALKLASLFKHIYSNELN